MPPAEPALDRALGFLAASQHESGRFPVQVGLHLTIDEAVDDASLFATSILAEALARWDEPRARSMCARAAVYLRAQMESPGVWRHWTRQHPGFHALPADVDDTACVSRILRDHGASVPDNRKLLLANRDPRGLFFTWLVVRRPLRPPAHGRGRILLRRAARPVHAHLFWRRTSAEPDDVDAVVNANVLAYLGDGPHAGAVVAHFLDILARGEEDRCDKWYRSRFVFYAAVGRCAAAGISGLEAGAPVIGDRIIAGARADGGLGDGPLDTALAMAALADLRVGEETRRRAGAYLRATQSQDGSWPAEPFYFGGPREHPDVPCWGSRALTTGLCAAALRRV